MLQITLETNYFTWGMLITTQGPAYLWGGVISAQGDLQPSSGGTIIVLSGYQHPSGGIINVHEC